MDQRLRALSAFVEDLSLGASSFVSELPTTYNSSCRISDTLSRIPLPPTACGIRTYTGA